MLDERDKRELDRIMERYKDDLEGLKAEKAKEKEAQENFMNEFNRLKREVIWPVFADIGNELSKYNHDFHISEEIESIDAIAHFQPASIAFHIYPASLDRTFYRPESTPYVAFVADRYARKIVIRVSTMMPGTGGVVGEHGSFETSKITRDFVAKEIVAVLQHTLMLDHRKK
jgi:hypothetical protein